MAKPDCDDGWIKLAHELLAAVLIADFSKRCLVVLREVFEQAYGPQKRRDIWLDPLDIARRSGLRRENVWHAISDLLKDGVLVENHDGSYRFAKDYERWTRKGSPRLSSAERGYACAAPDRASSPARRPSKSPRKDISARVSIDTRACLDRHTATPVGVSIETHMNPSPRVSIDTPHREERAAERIEKGELRSVVPSEHTQDALVCEDRDGNPAPLDGGVANPEAEVQAVADLAEELFPALSFDLNVSRARRLWPAAWMRRALIDAAAWADPPRSFVPIKNLLQRWTREGGPPAIKAPAPASNGKHAAIDRVGDWVPPSLRGAKP